MERGICAVHRNKRLECFCWDCQCIVCQFCMQEHSKRQHKTYNLHTLMKYAEKPKKQLKEKQEEEKAKKTEEKKEDIQKLVSVPLVNDEEIKTVNKIQSLVEELFCMKCGKTAVRSKDITLSCTHCAHSDCLKE